VRKSGESRRKNKRKLKEEKGKLQKHDEAMLAMLSAA
jgi:hypothetical protein